MISVPIARDELGITYPAARAQIDRLLQANILGPEAATVQGTAYYFASEIMAVLEGRFSRFPMGKPLPAAMAS
ncbi:MAG: hypothetical protein NVS2B17_19930 [Candidatus Velthaea sp.]